MNYNIKFKNIENKIMNYNNLTYYLVNNDESNYLKLKYLKKINNKIIKLNSEIDNNFILNGGSNNNNNNNNNNDNEIKEIKETLTNFKLHMDKNIKMLNILLK